MNPQIACLGECKAALIAFLWFFHCEFSNGCWNCQHQWTQSHIGCICLAFLQSGFSNVSSKCLPMQMQNHTGFICLTYFRCVFSNVSSNGLHEKMQSHIDCICLTFLHCAFLNVSSNGLHEKMQSHIGCICLIFLHQPHAQGRPLVPLNLSSLLQHCSWKTDKILSLKKTKKRGGNGSFFGG